MRPIGLAIVMAIALVSGCSATSVDHAVVKSPRAPVPHGEVFAAPTKSRDGALASCPNPYGLRAFSRSSTIAARSVAASYGEVSESVDLAHSDRSWWTSVRQTWARNGWSPEAVLAVKPATRSVYRSVVARSCGTRLVARSLAIVLGPQRRQGGPQCNACNLTVFLINRLNHPLVYFVY